MILLNQIWKHAAAAETTTYYLNKDEINKDLTIELAVVCCNILQYFIN